eukprot:TRINITY_DN7225_c0_g1_i1.p1 TRINITY_DN7225_c0_g1~~TRINITY_DN7225_c0_g1_i1.p1  ORF type:complete len:674 (-),score=113.51 TRINITY_DN7225_c0_g1_i1:23-1981(-)
MSAPLPLYQRRKQLRVLSVVLFLVGLFSLTQFPQHAHRTYVSENALMPGSARVDYSSKDLEAAARTTHDFIQFQKTIKHLSGDLPSWSRSCAEWIVSRLQDLNCDLDPRIFSYNVSLAGRQETRYQVYAVLKAPKADGTESIALTTRWHWHHKEAANGVSGLGLLVSILGHLRTSRWMAKDIIVLISDTDQGVRSWLDKYHAPHTYASSDDDDVFPRAGSIQAAINFDLPATSTFDQITLSLEGYNGQLPNLDLTNTIVRVARVEGLNTDHKMSLIAHPAPYPFLSSPYLPDELTTPMMTTLFTFMINQAKGVPTGPHGAFNTYHIDAVTVGVSPGTSYNSVMIGRVAVGTLRSLNNLLERLHQSFYFYVLCSPTHYLSIGEYMIPFGLLVAPLLVEFLCLVFVFADTQVTRPRDIAEAHMLKREGKTVTQGEHSMRQLPALLSVVCGLLFLALGLALYVLPLFARRLLSGVGVLVMEATLFPVGYIPFGYEIEFFLIYVILGAIAVRLLGSATRALLGDLPIDPSSFKLGIMIPVAVFIPCMSLLNFSFCTMAAAIVAPVYSFLGPSYNHKQRLMQALALLIVSPPALLMAISYFGNTNVPALMDAILDQHLLYRSLAYPFLTLVYIPLHLAACRLISLSPYEHSPTKKDK